MGKKDKQYIIITAITLIFLQILFIGLIGGFNYNNQYSPDYTHETSIVNRNMKDNDLMEDSGGDSHPIQSTVPQAYQPSSAEAESYGSEELFWWIHITDIHIEMDKEERLKNFDTFCNETVSIVDPTMVLSTGDQVDGGMTDERNQVGHDVEEFQYFNQTLEKYGYNQSFWYNVMGNHEQYNIPDSEILNYQKYLRSGPLNYDFTINTSFGDYRIIGIDTTQHIGLKNFLNLFGEAKREKLDKIERVIRSRDPNNYNHTILLGHHPLYQTMSETSSSGKTLKRIVDDGGVDLFLNGHVHRLGMHNHGEMVEIMGASFKETFSYRICAFDHDLFSFSEQNFDEWPATVITNPMDGRMISEEYPVKVMEQLPEIRTLIFDKNPITAAYVSIDGNHVGNLTKKQGNLWTLAWDPLDYNNGEHEISVVVQSESGKTTRTTPFVIGIQNSISSRSLTQMALAIPYYPIAIALITVCFCVAFTRILLPKMWIKKKSAHINKLEETGAIKQGAENNRKANHKETNRNNNNHNNKTMKYSRHPKASDFQGFRGKLFTQKFVKSAYLPQKLGLVLLAIPMYLLVGPAIIANFWLDKIGGIFIWGIFIGGFRIISLYSILIIGLYIISANSLQSYAILRYKDPKHKTALFSLFFALAGFMGSLLLVWFYYGIIPIFYNPINYLFAGIYAYVILKVEKSVRSSKNRYK